MSAKIFQLHKRSVYVFDAIQDKYSFDPSQTFFAISDGATQGYKSEIWAKSLVDSFIKSPTFDPQTLVSLFTKVAKDFELQDFSFKTDNPALRLAEERKKQQGAFATFMGIQLMGEQLLYISSGDVCGFLIREGKVFPFPHHTIDELENDKGFLGTRPLLNQTVNIQQFKTGNTFLNKNDIVLLATDALARLLLREQGEINKLLSFSNFEDFHSYIMNLWEQKRLEEDDITLCIITPFIQRETNCYLPPKGFSFPKEKTPNYGGIIPSHNPQNIESAKGEIIKLQQQLDTTQNTIHQLQEQNKWLKWGLIGLGSLLIIILGYDTFKKTPSNTNETITIFKEQNRWNIKVKYLLKEIKIPLQVEKKKDSIKLTFSISKKEIKKKIHNSKRVKK
jgi:hypothetical protein